MCDNDHFGQTDLSDTGLGEMERAWLLLVRLCCMSYEHNHVEGWDSALSHAEARFGAEDGPGIASRIAVLIRAMRAERRGGFGYLSPHCPSCRKRITDDEWLLIQLMQAGYLGNDRAIMDAAAEFARQPEAPVLTAAAARFGAALALAVGRTPRRIATSSLRLH
jgi:hypothetical protein